MKTILISQNEPVNPAPYRDLEARYGVQFVFRPFFRIEPLPGIEFRQQRIDLSRYTAVMFSSRHAIDAYFALCEESRFRVPETIKYFCSTDAVANYLQKHIVYRKRKIFFGDGTNSSVLSQITPRHYGEKFLICTSDPSSAAPFAEFLESKGCEYKVGVLVKPVSQDLTDLNLRDYSLVVLYNASDVASLFANFPGFSQGDVKFLSYGRGIVKAMSDAGLSAELQAPTRDLTSAVKAIEHYLSAH